MTPRVAWTADRDGQAHAAITGRLRTPRNRPPIDPRFGWPETRPRCAVCLAAVEEVLVAKPGRKAAGMVHDPSLTTDRRSRQS